MRVVTVDNNIHGNNLPRYRSTPFKGRFYLACYLILWQIPPFVKIYRPVSINYIFFIFEIEFFVYFYYFYRAPRYYFYYIGISPLTPYLLYGFILWRISRRGIIFYYLPRVKVFNIRYSIIHYVPA
ncbi:hypothetical protein A2331_06225 [Candidatus Falkowbacteria bacterium RIFOXYB2_FULL_34_18]|nr:MAG: hypothetical protein A2331_06225 [Candidatus Falkowbacteria bacterium RIFOXYB2_FULL_34_18]OGF28771.1 MAG: hypothetical protein A2500_04475 [Candidatus Falkowbacteria bacterium RIFOXYC12_FULL_34_55]OGF38417.1 MAG: hypothetical protein A2515_00580 [Candidatus Falkowbacteria bacterium RIFOXYD12_FULL_34_57]